MKNKILIIDDDPDILEPLAMLLEEEGYVVDTCQKADEAILKINKNRPELILLDVLLSGTDGRELCKKLKESIKTHKIFIIMMSAHPSAKNDATNCGANAFLPKPFKTEVLMEVIKKILK